MKLEWQSKVVLLITLPFTAAGLVLQAHWWMVSSKNIALWTLGLSALLGIAVIGLRAATHGAAAAGFALTANMMFATLAFPYVPWHTALLPVLAVSLMAHIATRIGRRKKERLSISEKRHGRTAAQISANLGIAAIVCYPLMQSWLEDSHWFHADFTHVQPLFAIALAALAEAAADTVSSELGQIFADRPRMLTTMCIADPGTDGAISLSGTLAGTVAALIVAASGMYAFRGGVSMLVISTAGGIFGMLFDSLLGATLERKEWLNNDAVNFLSTASAAAFAGLLLLFF